MRLILFFASVLLVSAGWAAPSVGMGYAPKYPPSFKHFDYVNPDAPKGGQIVLSASGAFDKLNPFTLRGQPPAGMGYSSNGFVFAESGLLFDSLLTQSEDEPFSAYGLLAEDVSLAEDGLSVSFRLRSEAKFSDGSPVLALDVKHSFDTLMSKMAAPTFRSYWGDVKEVVTVDERSVRFDFKRRNAELHMILGQLPIFSRAWGRGKSFDKLVSEVPISSGPYVVDSFEFGRRISYIRRSDYWAKDLPARKGMFNFDRVTYEYYKDRLGEEEAFKAGSLDAIEEGSISAWVRRYNGRGFESGNLIKSEISHRRFTGMQGLVLNLRQSRFQDVRVRQALALAFDFDWMNQRIFYNRRARTSSYFQNSPDLMADVQMSEMEKTLLSGMKERLRYEQLTQGVLPKPAASASEPSSLRAQLIESQRMLKDAGWSYSNGALRNADGTPFVIEMDVSDRASTAVLAGYVRNLGRLGVELRLRVRDVSLIRKRQNEFAFDMAINILGGSSSPGNELYDDFGSKTANEPGSQNLSGISDPVIDELIELIVHSRDRSSLAAATRLLDRFLLHQHYVIPMYYGRQFFLAHKERLEKPPAPLPQRLLAGSWFLTMWWVRPQ